jgi:hypothetical protein
MTTTPSAAPSTAPAVRPGPAAARGELVVRERAVRSLVRGALASDRLSVVSVRGEAANDGVRASVDARLRTSGRPLAEVLGEARHRGSEEVRRLLGRPVARLDLRIVELVADPAPGRVR